MGEAAWSVGIFTSREKPETVLAAVDAVAAAARQSLRIDVLVNGQRGLADSLLYALKRRRRWLANVHCRLWFIPLGDKAHAINEYVSSIWSPSRLAFFVDGYVRVEPDSLSALDQLLNVQREALGGSGAPSSGRDAVRLRETMRQDGGLHGNLFVLKAETMRRLREANIRLPLGLYRTDATLGAILAFDLDPSKNEWDHRRRVAVAWGASWRVSRRSRLSPVEILAQLRRMERQAQGDLENRAVAYHLAKLRRHPSTMPRTVSELVVEWGTVRSVELRDLLASRRIRRAWHALQRSRDWSSAELAPMLIYDTHADGERHTV